VVFDTTGGDAWTFEKTVSGHGSAPGECDEVLIRSPGGAIHARMHQGVFLARVRLRSGNNAVTAVCRRRGEEIGARSVQQWNVRLPDGPRASVQVHVIGQEVVLDGSPTTEAAGIPSPVRDYAWREKKGNPAPLRFPATPLLSAAHGKQLEVPTPPVDGRYYLTMRATDALGRSDETTAVFRVAHCRPTAVDTEHDHPEWADTAVVYGIALPLFQPGAFAAVTRRLDAIAALGATVIWLSPVTDAPANDFGYALTDAFSLRTAFGSDAQFRALIAAAHARGLHVILDAVTNQLSDQSRYFADARARGKSSPYYDWFARDANGRPVHYFDWINLENLNYDNPEVRSYLMAALTHWLKVYSADGFRVDAAWGLRQRAPEFWPQVRQELERVNPDVWLLAEASARDSYYARSGFDAAYDWTMAVGQWAWQGAFAGDSPRPDLAALRAALSAREALPALHFINNNDTGKRFITRHGVGEARVAAALLFTLPGVPLIYDGDETGAAFEPYATHGPLPWKDEYGLTEVYTRLAHTRRAVKPLLSAAITVLHTDHDGEVLAYARGDTHSGTTALVALNFSPSALKVALLVQPARVGTQASWSASDLLTGAPLPAVEDLRSVRLPGYGALLLQPRHGIPAAAAAGSARSACGGP
jgi:cyclomaltodextrinase / maltogenic alpha-amylase / neopullulanase